MLGIYASYFNTATRLDRTRVRPLEKRQRRWNAAGHWIDPPKEF